MTSELRCEEAQDLAAEMALGTLAGDERARLIAHIGDCSDCRATVEQLSKVADSLLLLAPEHEPPAGFESGFLAEFKGPIRNKRMLWVASAAAVVVVAVVAAGSVLWATAADRDLASHYRHALEEANGEYFGVKPVRSQAGTKIANLFAYEGRPSWVFVVFDEAVEPGEYHAEAISTTGKRSSLGSFTVAPDDLTWGTDLGGSLRGLGVIRFSSSSGEILTARITTSD